MGRGPGGRAGSIPAMTVSADVPTPVRIRVAHAHIQWVASAHAVRVLHIKGAALDDDLRWEGRDGTDADVLVSPRDADRFVSALEAAGWVTASTFRNGSAFEHAATLSHVEFGWADVHREFPGLGSDPAESFRQLWAERTEREIAGLACAVPSLPAQALILLLHAARSPGGRARLDVEKVWAAPPPSSARPSSILSSASTLAWGSRPRSVGWRPTTVIRITPCGA